MRKRERALCPICDKRFSIRKKVISTLRHAKRVKCPVCECMFFTTTDYPMPKYDAIYNKEFFRPTDIRKEGIMACKIATLLGPSKTVNKLLEVGTGNGLFTALMQIMEYRIIATDIDPQYCETLSNLLNIRVEPGVFERQKFKDKFALVYASHVLEHSIDPIMFVNKAYEVLDKDGLLYIATPDTAFQEEHEANWHHFKTRNLYEHCCLFSIKTIGYLAHKTNFKMLSVEQNPDYGSMEILLKKIPKV